MNDRDFQMDTPAVPEHFINARERTFEQIQKGEACTAPFHRLLRSAILAVALLLLLASGAAATVNRFGIIDFLNWNKTPAPSGADGVIRSDMGTTEGELYSASVEEAYFDGISFMLTVRYAVKDPQNALFVNALSGYWHDDEDFYRVGMTCELQGPEDPWQTLNEYEDATGGTRMRISAIDPAIVMEDVSWGGASTMLQQPDGSLLYVLQGILSQPMEGTASVSVRCGAIPAGTENPTVFDEIQIALKPSETAWQARYVPASDCEGWSIEGIRIASGRILMRVEIAFLCEPGTLTSGMDYWNLAIKDTNGNRIPLMDGGGETTAFPDGSFRCKLLASMLTPDGCPDALYLYLERDAVPPLGPIECRLAE